MIDAAVRGCHIIEWPPDSGKYLRANGDPDNPWSEKNTRQHRAVLDQVTGADRGRFLDWFATAAVAGSGRSAGHPRLLARAVDLGRTTAVRDEHAVR